jgi:hypothetical protein
MTSRDFCYWLQGYFEIAGNQPCQEPSNRWNLNDSQIDTIRKHLAMVFIHEIDPSINKVDPSKENLLNGTHNSTPPSGVNYRC